MSGSKLEAWITWLPQDHDAWRARTTLPGPMTGPEAEVTEAAFPEAPKPGSEDARESVRGRFVYADEEAHRREVRLVPPQSPVVRSALHGLPAYDERNTKGLGRLSYDDASDTLYIVALVSGLGPGPRRGMAALSSRPTEHGAPCQPSNPRVPELPAMPRREDVSGERSGWFWWLRGAGNPSMVDWFSARVLWTTAVRALWTHFGGKRSDRRHYQAFGDPGGVHHRIPHPEVWVDYVADTGDGYRATLGVAEMVLADHQFAKGARAPRADVLLMGGDLVYPDPVPDPADLQHSGYDGRLLRPFRDVAEREHTAMYDTKRSGAQTGTVSPSLPWFLALPGNHDWYDNLSEFSDRFTTQGVFRKFPGGFHVVQSRSYFTLQLGLRRDEQCSGGRDGTWWVFAVDTHVWRDLDAPQLNAMLDAASLVRAGDPVVLVCAEPFWRQGDGEFPERLAELVERLQQDRKAQLRLCVAGNLHHYRRELTDDCVRLTAGGGGAFTHPTHQLGEADPKPFVYPPRAASKRLALVNLLILGRSWWLIAMMTVLHLLPWWMLYTHVTGSGPWWPAVLEAGKQHPVWAALGLAIPSLSALALARYERSPGWWAHGLLFGATLTAVGAGSAGLAHGLLAADLLAVNLQPLLAVPLAGVASACVLGLYLTVLGWFGLSEALAFLGPRCHLWKSFLRMSFRPDAVDIYVIGRRSDGDPVKLVDFLRIHRGAGVDVAELKPDALSESNGR